MTGKSPASTAAGSAAAGSLIARSAITGSVIVWAVIWAVAAVIAVSFAMIHIDSAFIDGEFIPRTNDSFYHARRILDAAVGSGFYQFDPRLHVPDGSWISWPWGYDLLAAQALRMVLWLRPATDPMAFISHVPVAFAAVNCALFVAACRQAGLPASLSAIAALGLALLPVSQLMHSIGMIDHHFLEFTFVLLANWLGLRWISDRTNRRHAIALGAALGVAVAFHNGLFALQLPLLGCAFILWLRNDMAYRAQTTALGLSLVGTTLLAALPSEPFREFMFEFALLSWFHVYVALCTSIVLIIMASTRRSLRGFLVLAGAAAALSVPILFQALRGASFISGEMSYLETISEVKSPFTMFTEFWGPLQTASFYSWLIVVAPALLGVFAWRCLRESNPRSVYFAVWAVFGLALLLSQYRLHYFGLFALLAGPCLLLNEASMQYRFRRGIAVVIALGVLALAWQPALNDRLFTRYVAAGEYDYSDSRAIYKALQPLCEQDPGLVLADSNDGSPILFHTECSVISNNFIMRPQDEVAINRIFDLMTSTPEAILEHEPPIKYVYLHTPDFALPSQHDGSIVIDPESPIGSALLTNAPLPPGFETVHSVHQGLNPGDPVWLLSRLLRIDRSALE